MTTLRGSLIGKGKRFAIVVARFNEFITRRLLESALETLEQAGLSRRRVRVVWVPGALEIPFFCKKLAREKKWDAIIALGCVLRGGTYHFECVANEVTRGISQAALETGIPISTAVITADTLEQAIDRSGLKSGNKGAQAALVALEISDLNQQLIRKKAENSRQQAGIRNRKARGRKR
jgi:6,7-dimethyl-8-ribityllumazine synthase